MNSDLFTNINYEDFFLHFEENEADMSVAAVPYSVSVPYGIFNLNGRDILGIKEKPSYNYYANAGIYLIKRELLDLIPDNKLFNATDFMELLIARNHKVIRFPLTGYWIDIGKHEDYKKAQELVKHL
jgi:NDP-sugar pyrophosphorylase family protein